VENRVGKSTLEGYFVRIFDKYKILELRLHTLHPQLLHQCMTKLNANWPCWNQTITKNSDKTVDFAQWIMIGLFVIKTWKVNITTFKENKCL